LIDRPVQIITPEKAASQNDLWTAEITVALLARLYPVLGIVGGESDRLAGLARRINPSVEIKRSSIRGVPTITVGINSETPGDAISARADGWVARVESPTQPRIGTRGPANAYSAAAAGALAASQLFRWVFSAQISTPWNGCQTRVSLLDFTEDGGADLELQPVDVGEVAVIGLGAVANAALWAWSRQANLRGMLHLVDPERIELSNLQRYVLIEDADVGLDKTMIAQRALERTTLSCVPHATDLGKFADGFPTGWPFSLACISVDNVIGRRTAQALLPKMLVNGWTSEAGLGASWHEFARDAACLACLYQPTGVGPSQIDLAASALGLPTNDVVALWVTRRAPSDAQLTQIGSHLGASEAVVRSWRDKLLSDIYSSVVCGMASLDLKGLGHMDAVPLAHQSALAGIFMAAEAIKRADSSLGRRAQAESLVVWNDVLGQPPKSWGQPRARVKGCICSDATYQSVYAQKWPSSSLGQ
jgi:hypothetical protein